MHSNSRAVSSNQLGTHEKLIEVVNKHLQSEFKRPILESNLIAFEEVLSAAEGKPWVLDSGCGTGRSTAQLAKRYPDAFVVGVDKSIHRLAHHYQANEKNYLLVRADLIDFIRLCDHHDIRIIKHYILYPNPWPKKKHLVRRFHGSPIFGQIINICNNIEIRSNWRIYLEEFQLALDIAGIKSFITEFTDASYHEAMTNFEEKYLRSDQTLWKLQTTLLP